MKMSFLLEILHNTYCDKVVVHLHVVKETYIYKQKPKYAFLDKYYI